MQEIQKMQEILDIARELEEQKIIEMVQDGMDINQRNSWGMRMIEHAAMNSSVRLVSALIDAGSNLTAVDHKGNSVAHFAVFSNNPELIKLLEGKGVDMNIRNLEGKTPLDFVSSSPLFQHDKIDLEIISNATRFKRKTTDMRTMVKERKAQITKSKSNLKTH